MDKRKKIAIGITAAVAFGAIGYWIYKRQTGAKTAIAQNTVDPSTGLTPIELQAIAAQAGPLAKYENKFIRLKGSVEKLFDRAVGGPGFVHGVANPCYLIKNGGFQWINHGKMGLVVQRVLGIADVTDCTDAVKKGIVTEIDRKEYDILRKAQLLPLMTINR